MPDVPNRHGIATPLSAAEIALQEREDQRAAAADIASLARDQEAGFAQREQSAAVWDHALHDLIRKALVLFASPRWPRDADRQIALRRLQSDLADAQALLWPK